MDTIGCRGTLGQIVFMLQTMCAGPDGFLHLVGHSWPPEAFLQQGPCTVTPLMACISVASIQSGNTFHTHMHIYTFVFTNGHN